MREGQIHAAPFSGDSQVARGGQIRATQWLADDAQQPDLGRPLFGRLEGGARPLDSAALLSGDSWVAPSPVARSGLIQATPSLAACDGSIQAAPFPAARGLHAPARPEPLGGNFFSQLVCSGRQHCHPSL